MESYLSTFLFLIVSLLVLSSNTDAASTTNGKLLKFYPITKQQYRDILALTKQQSAISETDVVETHRSLADWSNTLHSSWNALFNATGGSLNKTLGQNGEKSYPICVIKTRDHERRRRGARQYNYNNAYAGLAPNGVYPGYSYYGRPSNNRRRVPLYYQTPYEEENNEDDEELPIEDEDEGEDPENNDTEPEEMPDIDIEIDDNNGGSENDSNSPIINCVVVIRRKNQIINKPLPPDDDIDDNNDVDEIEHPQYPPYPYPYPPYPPHGHYPYPYPPHPQPSSRSNRISAMDPEAAVHYQQMIAEYYRHLHSLYMADATTGMP